MDNPFKKITIPLIRRIYPQLIANDLVSVEPLISVEDIEYYDKKFTNKKKKKYRSIDDAWEGAE